MKEPDDDTRELDPPSGGDPREESEQSDWQDQVEFEGDKPGEIADADLEPTLGYGLDEPTGPGGSKPWLWVALAVLVLAGAGWWWWNKGDQQTAPATASQAEATAPRSSVPEAQPVELPELSASDEFVRRLVAEIAAHPELTRWLAHDALVRRFVASVEVVTAGGLPRDNLDFLTPETGFAAGSAGLDRWRASTANHQRFDDLLTVMQLVDPADAARIVRTITPLADEARRDLGYPEGNSRAALDRAIAHLVRVSPQLASEPLVREGEIYLYQDPTVEEGLSPAQKALLRLGPEQAAWVQAWLHSFHDSLVAADS